MFGIKYNKKPDMNFRQPKPDTLYFIFYVYVSIFCIRYKICIHTYIHSYMHTYKHAYIEYMMFDKLVSLKVFYSIT